MLSLVYSLPNQRLGKRASDAAGKTTGEIQKSSHMEGAPKSLSLAESPQLVSSFEKCIDSGLLRGDIFSFSNQRGVAAVAQTSKKLQLEVEVFYKSKPYIHQFDNMVMLAANACMRGIKLLDKMTEISCLKDIVNHDELTHSEFRLTTRQLETLLFIAIDLPSLEAFQVLIEKRLAQPDSKIIGSSVSSSVRRLLFIMKMWAESKRDSDLSLSLKYSLVPNPNREIIITIITDFQKRYPYSVVPENIEVNKYWCDQHTHDQAPLNEFGPLEKDSNNSDTIEKFKNFLENAEYLFFTGYGVAFNCSWGFVYNMFHHETLVYTEMRNLLLRHGGFPNEFFFDRASSTSRELRNKFESYGLVESLADECLNLLENK